MFANFKEAFKKDKEDKEEIVVPKDILDYLTSKLPEDFKYTKGPKGSAVLTTTNDRKMKVEVSIKPKFPYNDELKTTDDIMEYAYRTQQEIPLDGSKLTINGVKFEFKDLISYPLDPDQEVQDFVIAPSPFPPAVAITLQAGEVDKQVMVERKPYADMHKRLYGSVQDESFTISYVLNESTGMVKFSFNIDINKAKSIKEIVESITLYDAFQNGSIRISDFPLPKADKSDIDSRENQESLNFWKKVYALEKKLGVTFIPEMPLSQEDAQWFSKLHRSLIEEEPFKLYGSIDKFSSTEAHVFKKAIEEDRRKLTITFIEESKLTIFGVNLTLYGAIGLFNFVMKNVVDTQSKNAADVYIEPADDKGIYTSTRYFLNLDEAKAYKMKHAELLKAEELQW